MNRINFVGNALFIPFFLIGVGMLVDISVLFKGFGALKVAFVMITGAVGAKYVAALLTQKTFRLSVNERQIIFGLSNARVGATLAVVLVGYNVIMGETPNGEPIRLLNEDVLNGTILMILITCTISSFTVERASRKIALLEHSQPGEVQGTPESILISLAYPETVNELVDLALLLTPNQVKPPLYALHVIDEKENSGNKQGAGKRMMENAIKHAASTDNTLIPITRFDVNVSNGIIYTIREHNITDLIIGLHHLARQGENFFGPVAEKILNNTNETIFIYKPVQPVNTLKRIIVTVPPKAEYELGFLHWFHRLLNMSKETALPLHIYASRDTIKILQATNAKLSSPSAIEFREFNSWEDFLIFSREVKQDDLFIIVSSRKGYLSYIPELDKFPRFLVKYFEFNSYIILYPHQAEVNTPAGLQAEEESVEVFKKKGSIVRKF
jgi:hypothetical protein